MNHYADPNRMGCGYSPAQSTRMGNDGVKPTKQKQPCPIPEDDLPWGITRQWRDACPLRVMQEELADRLQVKYWQVCTDGGNPVNILRQVCDDIRDWKPGGGK